MNMVVLKSIEPVSFGKILAVFYAIIGFMEGLFFSVIFGLISSLSGRLAGSGALGVGSSMQAIFGAIGVVSIIAFPIIGALAGFILGAIAALVYNFVASKIGGIEVELK